MVGPRWAGQDGRSLGLIRAAQARWNLERKWVPRGEAGPGCDGRGRGRGHAWSSAEDRRSPGFGGERRGQPGGWGRRGESFTGRGSPRAGAEPCYSVGRRLCSCTACRIPGRGAPGVEGEGTRRWPQENSRGPRSWPPLSSWDAL